MVVSEGVGEGAVEFKSKRKGSKKVKTQPKGVTRDVIRNFLLHLFDAPAVKSSSSPFTLVLDNASIHKGDIPEVIFQVGHTPIFLPPYSPPLNPIEYAFSQWKMHYRAFYSASETEVDESIHKAATAITPADCQHYFDHAQSWYPKAVAMEDL